MPRYRLIPLNIDGLPENNGEIKWDAIAGKPATFPPDSHSHEWNAIAGKPATFPPSAHDHGIITSSSVPSNPSKGLIWNELDTNANFLMEWVWNGSNWLEKRGYIGATASITNAGGSNSGARAFTQAFGLNYNVFLSSLGYSVYPTGLQDANNYWAIQVVGITPRGAGLTIAQDNTILYASQVKPTELYLNKSLAINTLLNFNTGSSYPNIQISLTKIGSPTGGCHLHAQLVCRLARP